MTDNDTPDKAALHEHCCGILASRVADLEAQLADLAASVANETKSTAGDKYETARAMLHIEQDQVRRQLMGFREQLAVLQGLDTGRHAQRIGMGSLVELDRNWFYIGTGLGKVSFGGKPVFVLSADAPLGLQLAGQEPGATIIMNGKPLRVGRVL